MTTPTGHSFACQDGNHEACARRWCDCACHPVPSWVKAGEGATASAPVSTTLTIGGVSFPVGEISYSPARPRPPAVVSGPLSFKFDVAFEASEVAAFRALFSPTPSPLSTVTLTSRDCRGNLRTETFEGVTVDVVFARRGRKRPGQWTDRTRARRARRLERAEERRAGISRRGLRHGFPLQPYRSLAAIHEETRRALVEHDAQALMVALDSPGGPVDDFRRALEERYSTGHVFAVPPNAKVEYLEVGAIKARVDETAGAFVAHTQRPSRTALRAAAHLEVVWTPEGVRDATEADRERMLDMMGATDDEKRGARTAEKEGGGDGNH